MLIKTSRKGNTMGGKHRLGRNRSTFEENLQKEWGSSSWTEEQIDKAKYLEKKHGLTDAFIHTKVVDAVK